MDIPIYSSQVMPRAVPNYGTVSAFERGGAEAQGTADLGAQLQASGAKLYKKAETREEQEQATAANSWAASTRLEWMQRVQQMQDETGADPSGFGKRVAQEYQGQIQKSLEAPDLSEYQRTIMQREATNIGESLASHALAFEAQGRTQYRQTQVDDTLGKLANVAARDPSQYDELYQQGVQTIDNSGLPGPLAEAARQKWKDDATKYMLQGKIERAPAAVISELDKGAYDERLDPSSRAALYNQAQAGVRRLEAEARMNRLARQGKYQDITAALADGKTAPWSADQVREDFGEKDAPQVIEKLTMAQDLGTLVNALPQMDATQRVQQAEKIHTDLAASPTEGYATREKFAQAQLQAIGQFQQKLNDDPVAVAAQRPSVQGAYTQYTAAAAGGDPATAQAAFNNYQQASFAAQRDMGVAAPRIVSNDQAKQIVSSYVSAAQGGEHTEAAAQQLSAAIDLYGPAVVPELAAANLPTSAVALGMFSGASRNPQAEITLARMSVMKDDQITKLMGDESGKSRYSLLTDAVSMQVGPAVGALMARQDTGNAMAIQEGVKRLAAGYALANPALPLQSAVTRAYNEIIGQNAAVHSVNGDQVMVPKTDPYDVEAERLDLSAMGDLIKNNLPVAALDLPIGATPGQYLPDVLGGTWITSPDNAGMLLQDRFGAPVSINGKQVMMPFTSARTIQGVVSNKSRTNLRGGDVLNFSGETQSEYQKALEAEMKSFLKRYNKAGAADASRP